MHPDVGTACASAREAELTGAEPLRRLRRRSWPRKGRPDMRPQVSDADELYTDLHVRMFTASGAEDPATGSATASASALLAELRG
jgi:hypothetical protein